MAIRDADRVGGGSRQLFLASAVRRELGPGPLFPRATLYARPALLAGIPRRGPAGRVLSHPPAAAMVEPTWRLPAGRRKEKIVKSPRFTNHSQLVKSPGYVSEQQCRLPDTPSRSRSEFARESRNRACSRELAT